MIKSLLLKAHLSVIVVLITTTGLFAQNESPAHAVYMISNLESLSPTAPEFDVMQSHLKNETAAYTLIINGDFIDKNGMGSKPSEADITKADRLLSLVGDKGNILFIPGDREWDNGGKKGLKKVQAIQKYLESKMDSKKIILPRNGCLGPNTLDIGDQLRIIAINSQWFTHPHKRPEEEDTDCKIFNEHEFWDEVDDALADADNRNIIVALHHPPLSYGQYGGYKLHGKYWFPVFGSMVASYHQNVGDQKDLANADLKHFSSELLKKAEKHPGLIIVSGHEYDLQLLEKEGNYFINSGAFAKGKPVARGDESIYRQKEAGFAKLNFQKDGTVAFNAFSISSKLEYTETYQRTLFSSPCDDSHQELPANLRYSPCPKKYDLSEINESNKDISGAAIAGKHYKAGFLRRSILGKNYRDTWANPILNIPYLDIDTTFGGMRPYAKGGSAQTTSLKFKSKDGQRFAFRSIDKNPTRRMDKDLAAGIYGKLSKDRTSHQHPYASIVVASFMDQLELPHSNPRLFLMPDHPGLGQYREEFAHTYGFLELKPKGKNKTDAAFLDADKVVSSFQMFRKLLDDNDNRLDVDNYIKARVIDFWVGDWDRHENNWKWLAYKGKKGYTYQPFAKDRDKALSVLDGIYGIRFLKALYINKGDFTPHYYQLKYLNFKSRNMDRWLANSYTRADWMAVANNVKELMTDEVIDEAIAKLPPEAQVASADKLRRILRARRDGLPAAIEKYYRMLARYIDLVGSNSADYFELDRKANGNVTATIYKLKKNGETGKKLYEREFIKSETREIRLYGLGKKDQFKITGEADKSILIRVIGGDGEDTIEDQSKVKGPKKLTRIYDYRKKDKISAGSEAKMGRSDEAITFKTESLFNYNDATFLPSLAYNQDDGLAIGLGGTIIRHNFNKPDFSKKINVQAIVTTNRNYNFNLDAQFRHVIKEWDLLLGGSIARRDKTMRKFYGFGNEVVVNDSLNQLRYYTNFTGSTTAYVGLTKTFWQKSHFSAKIKLDFKDVQPTPDKESDASIYDDLPPNNGLGETTALGPEISLNIDFRDNASFPTRGMQFTLDNYTFYNSDLDWEMGGRAHSELSAFITRGIRVPVTLALRGEFTNSYGDTPYYYKSFLGQQSNHRGFLRNRFGGDAALALNTDLRFHFGQLVTPLVPVKYGIFGLYDVGRVWLNGEDSDGFHYAYGGGIYLIPYADTLNLTFTFAHSDEGDDLFSFRVGFFVR